MLDGLIVSSGIDYISASMKLIRPNAVKWYHNCINYIETIASDGNELYHGRRNGNEGFVCGGSFVGVRDDGYFCTISGERAQDGFNVVYSGMPHVSRLDVQATVRLPTRHTDVAYQAREAVRRSNIGLSKA